jgi:hypothetical protein
MVLSAHQALMCFIESFFLREHDIGMTIAFGIIDLFDDFEANVFILLDIVEPIVELGPVLGSDYLV